MAPSRGGEDMDTCDNHNTNIATTETPIASSRRSSFELMLPAWIRKSGGGGDDSVNNEHNPYHDWNFFSPQSQSQSHQQSQPQQRLSLDEYKASTIASCYLNDYEEGRHPTLSPNFCCITDKQLQIYRIKHSWQWRSFGISLATILLFVCSFSNRYWTLSLHMISVILLLSDVYMKQLLLDKDYVTEWPTKMDKILIRAVTIFLMVFTIQNWIAFLFLENPTVHPTTLVVSMFKPIVFFYESRRARDALEALCRIGKKLLRVILIELFLILTFAAVACRLYNNDESFNNLGRSWLSLFARKLIFLLKYCTGL